jgi:hypothetical protein
MAEEKKSAFNPNTVEELTFLLAGLFLLGLLLGQIGYFLGLFEASGLLALWRVLVDFLARFWPIWKVIAALIVLACIAWSVYSYIKIQQIESEEEKIFGRAKDDTFAE